LTAADGVEPAAPVARRVDAVSTATYFFLSFFLLFLSFLSFFDFLAMPPTSFVHRRETPRTISRHPHPPEGPNGETCGLSPPPFIRRSAAVLAYRLQRLGPPVPVRLAVIPVLVGVVGMCSTAFHTTATYAVRLDAVVARSARQCRLR
jgi:hypothetical protein